MIVQTAPGWGKKTIWLRDLAEAGPVILKFTHGIIPSKYEGRIPFAPFRLLGDDTKYALQIETEGLEKVFSEIPVMAWVILEHRAVPHMVRFTLLDDAPSSTPAPQPRRPVAVVEETHIGDDGPYNTIIYVTCDDGAVFAGKYTAGSTHIDSWVETSPIPGTPRSAQLADN